MKLLDTYALSCGAKINKPFIYTSYFPIPYPKYITFQAQSQANIPAKHYDYFQDVIDLITPWLHKANINIIQVGQGHEPPYTNVVDLRGQTTVNHMAYIIKNALLHFGPDSFGLHLASAFDIPLVGLYSSTYAEISGPQFGTSDKHILFKGYERIKNKKPSFALVEDPKSINSIKPEEIAKAIFKLLNIEAVIPFETMHIGKRYSHNIIRELIPNFKARLDNPEAPIEIRMDLHHDEQTLAQHLSYLQKAVIITNKKINTAMLQHFKAHIPLVIFKITEDNDNSFVKELLAFGFNIMLLSELQGQALIDKKIQFYEYGTINQIGQLDNPLIDKLKMDIGQLYFRSCKLTVANEHYFNSTALMALQQPMTNRFEYQKVIDNLDFWKDLDFFTIIKKT